MSNNFSILGDAVRKCGAFAKENQAKIHRSFKADGTVLTETDLEVSRILIEKIRELFPTSNIVTEEISELGFNENAPYTFVLDPIDGTDSYSQGLPSWCIALGVLDSERKPCGAIICAPRFGVGTDELFIYSAPDSEDVYLNGILHKPFTHKDIPQQIAIGSDVLESLEIHSYKGKLRSYGSSILHMLCPVLFSNIDCTFNSIAYVWDIVASHSIALKSGFEVIYSNGSEVIYNDKILLQRQKYPDFILVGSPACNRWIQDNFTRKDH